MSITAVFVLFSVTWFLVFFLVLQINQTSQSDEGEIVAGTPASAPANVNMKRKAMITTLISVPVTGAVIWVILSGLITIDMFDFYNVIKN